jgi:hypothetical protein
MFVVKLMQAKIHFKYSEKTAKRQFGFLLDMGIISPA